MRRPRPAGEVMRPGEVAAFFKVKPRTVTRWANQGKLRYFRTPLGHRRYLRSEVEAFRSERSQP